MSLRTISQRRQRGRIIAEENQKNAVGFVLASFSQIYVRGRYRWYIGCPLGVVVVKSIPLVKLTPRNVQGEGDQECTAAMLPMLGYYIPAIVTMEVDWGHIEFNWGYDGGDLGTELRKMGVLEGHIGVPWHEWTQWCTRTG